jgi:tetratricopeptide (TPR) repeat protein
VEQAADPDWVLLELEPAKAARAGLPDRIVAPRAEAESGSEVERPVAARWGAAFAAARPEHRLAPALAALAAAEPYRLLAQKLVGEGRPGEAAIALARAIELAPYDAASRVNRANALQRAGDHEEALAELEEAEWAYSNDAAFHGARGSVLESLDEPDRAIAAYERALELAPATASCSTGSRASAHSSD